MLDSNNKKNPIPVVASIDAEDDHVAADLKDIINSMTRYNSNERVNIDSVVGRLKGKCIR